MDPIGRRRVTELDLNEGMLAVARRFGPAIDWRQGDAAQLPCEDGVFDVVVSQFALVFFPDRVGALREMWRVVAPRGRLAVAVCAPVVHTEGYSALTGILRREVGNIVEGYFALGEEAELHRLCNGAGLAGARVQTREGWARSTQSTSLCGSRPGVRLSPASSDETSYRSVLTAARQELRDFR